MRRSRLPQAATGDEEESTGAQETALVAPILWTERGEIGGEARGVCGRIASRPAHRDE